MPAAAAGARDESRDGRSMQAAVRRQARAQQAACSLGMRSGKGRRSCSSPTPPGVALLQRAVSQRACHKDQQANRRKGCSHAGQTHVSRSDRLTSRSNRSIGQPVRQAGEGVASMTPDFAAAGLLATYDVPAQQTGGAKQARSTATAAHPVELVGAVVLPAVELGQHILQTDGALDDVVVVGDLGGCGRVVGGGEGVVGREGVVGVRGRARGGGRCRHHRASHAALAAAAPRTAQHPHHV